MKTRNQCVYRNVCCGGHQRCRSCQLKFAPYDQKIAMQLEKDNRKSKYKFGEDESLDALRAEVLAKKSNKGAE